MSAKKILVVEDELAIRDLLGVVLQQAGYEYVEAGDVHTAQVRLVDQRPDLVLLDWMLPDASGIELIRRMKREPSTADIPVILLTARVEEDNKIQGLEVGADDYVTKPFSPRELLARVKALLRRSSGADDGDKLNLQGLVLDVDSHRASIDGAALPLGPTEFKLLQFFMQKQNRVFSRAQILDQVWGSNVYVEERTVDVHIRRLRKGLRQLGDAPIDYGLFIQTVRGTGYRFSDKV